MSGPENDPGSDGCGGHAGLAGEFRTLLLQAIDRADPVVERLRGQPPGTSPAAACSSCPVCAVLAALRGERTEYTVRVAEHVAGMLAVLRVALAEGDPAAEQPSPPESPQPTTGGRTVERIPVVRVESRR